MLASIKSLQTNAYISKWGFWACYKPRKTIRNFFNIWILWRIFDYFIFVVTSSMWVKKQRIKHFFNLTLWNRQYYLFPFDLLSGYEFVKVSNSPWVYLKKNTWQTRRIFSRKISFLLLDVVGCNFKIWLRTLKFSCKIDLLQKIGLNFPKEKFYQNILKKLICKIVYRHMYSPWKFIIISCEIIVKKIYKISSTYTNL